MISNKNEEKEGSNNKSKFKETVLSFAIPFDINPNEKRADIEKYYK